MILVLSCTRTQSLNEGDYEDSLTHMPVPAIWVDAVVFEGGQRSLAHTLIVSRVGVFAGL